jgi:hypothetical protein
LKVSGFTIARNVVRADYPLREAVYSILPLCDEFVIAVGKSEDSTLEFVRSFDDPRIRIIETEWDDTLREGGRVLAVETNKAKAAVSPDSDWLFYIQADEVLHEQYLEVLREKMKTCREDREVQGFLFDYVHFYGSYSYVGDSRKWYRNEVRIIRNDARITSWGDAMGFKTTDGKKLRVVNSGASIYHYGWVKHPREQQAKQQQFHKLWHKDEDLGKMVADANEFDYTHIDSLAHFSGTHPQVMKERIARMNWEFDHDISRKNFNLKSGFLYLLEKLSGWRAGEYRNFKLLKDRP